MCEQLDLDALDWKPWPKDPAWSYADILGVVRVSRRCDKAALYSVASLKDGKLSHQFSFHDATREDATRLLIDAIQSELKTTN